MQKITFLGGGNMGEAFIASLCKNKIFAPSDITVIEKNGERNDYLSEKYGINPSQNIEDIKNSEIIFLAIKPQGINDLSTFTFEKDQAPLCISILAGTKIEKIAKKFLNTKIVRTMPNLGQFVGQGMTGIYFNETNNFTEKEKKIVKNIFIAGGKIAEVDDENQLDAITAISGSGPAYFFYFLEIFEKIAKNLGFDEANAELLAKQTLIGATDILKANPNDTAKEWRKRVTSKGGTTEAACHVLENSDFEKLFTHTIKAAKKRAEELGK